MAWPGRLQTPLIDWSALLNGSCWRQNMLLIRHWHLFIVEPCRAWAWASRLHRSHILQTFSRNRFIQNTGSTLRVWIIFIFKNSLTRDLRSSVRSSRPRSSEQKNLPQFSPGLVPPTALWHWTVAFGGMEVVWPGFSPAPSEKSNFWQFNVFMQFTLGNYIDLNLCSCKSVECNRKPLYFYTEKYMIYQKNLKDNIAYYIFMILMNRYNLFNLDYYLF